LNRVDVYVRLAARARADLVTRFSRAPEPSAADPIELVPAQHAWGVERGDLFAPDGLPLSIVSRAERFKVGLLATLQRWLPNELTLTRWDRATAQRELLSIIGEATPIEGWQDTGTDAAWARLFVQGPLAGHLTRVGEDLVLDCTGLRGLRPHAGLVPLGCRGAVRDCADGLVPAWVELEDGQRVTPGEPGWERARLIFACSMQTWTVVVAHLVHVHYLTTGAVAAAAQLALPWSHPLRRLLEPHVAGTLLVNWRANRNLLGPRGAVQSAYSYPWSSLVTLVGRGVEGFDPTLYDLPSSLERRGLMGLVTAGRYPFGEDALLVWQVLERYVRRYVGVYFKADAQVTADSAVQAFAAALARLTVQAPRLDGVEALVGLLTRHLHVATVIHKTVGGMAWDFMTMPWFMPHRLRDTPKLEDMLPYREESQANLIGKWATTPMSWPLCRDWSGWALDADGAAAMRALQDELRAAGAEIDARNARRLVPFPYFHPDRLESSVAV
jgi:hypothetical protein